MKITHAEVIRVPPSWIWVKVYADDGTYGLGEPYLPGHANAVIDETNRLGRLIVGEDPLRVEAIWQRMYNDIYYYRVNPIKLSAMSGIDQALWDLRGKALGVSVAELLGGPIRTRFPVYCGVANGSPINLVPPGESRQIGDVLARPTGGIGNVNVADWVDQCRDLVDTYGFQCIKLHCHPDPSLAGLSQVDAIVAIVEGCRNALGFNIDLAVDLAHPHPNVAFHLVEALAPYRLLFIEDPQEIETFDSLRDITARSSTPIAASTEWMTKWTYYDAIRAGVRIVQPDLCHAGGITETKKIVSLAECVHGYAALHTANSIVQFMAALQVHAAIPNGLVQEHNPVLGNWDGRHYRFGVGYVRNAPTLGRDGMVEVPNSPGLGIDLDDDGLAEIMKMPWHDRRA